MAAWARSLICWVRAACWAVGGFCGFPRRAPDQLHPALAASRLNDRHLTAIEAPRRMASRPLPWGGLIVSLGLGPPCDPFRQTGKRPGNPPYLTEKPAHGQSRLCSRGRAAGPHGRSLFRAGLAASHRGGKGWKGGRKRALVHVVTDEPSFGTLGLGPFLPLLALSGTLEAVRITRGARD